ncbi:RHS repeat protein [Variovorax sp. B4]|uniref:RHS repeat protein n=1 Tax=Variovorax sp. B4 TaxID=2021405 RepID=UPI000C999D7B|nr:RHS repeat protein [Variovorax sp. B4]PNG55676.1 hypothetical protein CHC07_02086 [Variovorax sp. B4]
MTTINSSVFDDIRLHANTALLDRALILINNQSLTTLEDLRVDLAAGNVKIRLMQPSDNMPPQASAIYVRPDPQRPEQPGYLVLRPENLARATDANVLSLVDDLNHEGRHHTNLEVRVRLQESLEFGSAPANERGDIYMQGWLDDETASRLDSYELRLQINALPGSEYKGSNLAVLASNPLYQRFAEVAQQAEALGLTGSARNEYIVENSRADMGRDSNHFYRDNATAHIVGTTQMSAAEAAAYREHVANTFHSPGYTVESQTYDDGSSHVWVRHEDGSVIEFTHDLDGHRHSQNEIQADGDQTGAFYAVDGRIISLFETDGAGDNADYNTRTATYDAQGRTDWIDVRRDDGTRDTTDYDQDSTQAWSRVESRFDAQGREDYANVFIDDGSRTVHDYDQTNARGDRVSQTHIDPQGRTDWTYATLDDGGHDWIDHDQTGARGDSIWQNRTDAQGREDWRYVTLDDGGHEWTDFDQAGARGDSSVQSRTDAWGRQDWVNIVQDDGSRDWTDHDQDGSQGWSVVTSRFDAWGRQDYANVYADDGSRDQHDYDQDGSKGWNAVVSHFDAWGREAHASMYQDDGSRDWVDHDQDGSQGWSRVESHFDAWGREAHATMYQDDGSRDWHDYDQDGSQGWSALVSHFDASGREAHANLYMDDGSRNWYDYDETGSQAWSRVESRFDTSGREDEASMFFDDGRRRRYDYDQDGSQYWSRVEQDFDAFGRETTANIFHDDGARTLVDYSSAPGYRLVSRYNAQGYLILKEEATAWLPGGPLPAPLPPAVGPLPAMPFYAPPSAAPHNPFISPAFPFPSQPSWSLPVVDDDPYPDAYVEVGPLTPSEPW